MNTWIDFEGIDGSGKTSVSTKVAKALRAQGVEVVHAREGGQFASEISGRVRELARSEESLCMAPETELLLNLAREAQLIAEVIRPALRRGACVITDRTTYSHVGLARYVRGLSGSEVEAAARLALQGCRPDRVFLIDVDPDIARWRRRVRKVQDRKLSEAGGRKGQRGDSLISLTRKAFLDFAAADQWAVVDNTWQSLEDSVKAVLDGLAGKPVPKSVTRAFERNPEDLLGSYFDFVDRLSDRSLAALLAAGLDDPRADAIRRRASADLAAFAVTGMDTPAAWALRHDLRHESPYYVARGLVALGTNPRAWELRRELESVAPDQVLHGLSGEGTPEAHELRKRHFEDQPEESVRSTRWLGDPPSWELRQRARRERPSPALAESLLGLNDPLAAELRSELRGAFPLAVLRGARGVDHPDAWALRRELAAFAPKTVLGSLEGLGGPEAMELRDSLRKIAPEEVAASLAQVDTEESWKLRWDMADEAPVGALKSVRRVERTKAEPFVARVLERHGSRLRVAREAVQFALRTPWTISSD